MIAAKINYFILTLQLNSTLKMTLFNLWSGVMEWSLGVESWSGVLEWTLEWTLEWNEVIFAVIVAFLG